MPENTVPWPTNSRTAPSRPITQTKPTPIIRPSSAESRMARRRDWLSLNAASARWCSAISARKAETEVILRDGDRLSIGSHASNDLVLEVDESNPTALAAMTNNAANMTGDVTLMVPTTQDGDRRVNDIEVREASSASADTFATRMPSFRRVSSGSAKNCGALFEMCWQMNFSFAMIAASFSTHFFEAGALGSQRRRVKGLPLRSTVVSVYCAASDGSPKTSDQRSRW